MDLFKEHGITLEELITKIAIAINVNELSSGYAELAETLQLVEIIAREAGYTK